MLEILIASPLLVASEAAPALPHRSVQDAPAFARDSGGELLPEEAAYDVRHYALHLTVLPDEKRIVGQLTMRADLVAPTAAIVMDLDPELRVTGVHVAGSQEAGSQEAGAQRDGAEVEVRREQDRLFIPVEGVEVGAEFSVRIDYDGAPREADNPPWSGGFTWAETATGEPWIATSCQGEGADLWWPCKDHPSDEADGMQLNIKVPAGLTVATNGRLGGVTTSEAGTFHVHHWSVSTPINNYGVALAIAPFETLHTVYENPYGDTFPFTFWVLPEAKEKAERVFAEFQEHMRVMEELCGPYPFRGDKYGIAHVPFLGMEHQTIIAYGNRFGNDPWYRLPYDALHQHELAHEWWGNLVTARDWSDFWIHEGIGTYMQALHLERTEGPDVMRRKMQLDRGMLSNRGAVAPRSSKSTKWMYFAGRGSTSPGGDIYYKGSWVCHTLRWLLTDDVFFQVLRRWAYPDPGSERTTDGSACRFETTDGLLAIAERVSEQELAWFFEVYLRRPTLPRLDHAVEDGVLTLRWQLEGDLPFPMPVEVQVGDELVRVETDDDGVGTLAVGDAEVAIDPNGWLLRARR